MTKDKEPTAAPDDPKRQALMTVLEAIAPLDRTGKLDVLRAAAGYHGIVLGSEIR